VTNLDQIKGTPTGDQKVCVLCAISRNSIIGPIFIYDTINSECYCEIILYPFTGHLNEDETACGHFQQDSATAHTAPVSMMLLHVFGHRLISKDIWPPQLPDITPPYYYLWGAMKCAVYRDKPHTLFALKEVITNFIKNIPQTELSLCFCKQDETSRCMSTSMWGPFPPFLVT
jgi:hypothetical protein